MAGAWRLAYYTQKTEHSCLRLVIELVFRLHLFTHPHSPIYQDADQLRDMVATLLAARATYHHHLKP